MDKKKIISILVSAILSLLATIFGCIYGIDVDFSGEDVGETPTSVNCSIDTHEQP